MTTTGYGDYSATNALEMIFASMVMVFGKLLFGFILGSIASTLANSEIQRVLFEEKLSAIKVKKQTFVATLCMLHFVIIEYTCIWLHMKISLIWFYFFPNP